MGRRVFDLGKPYWEPETFHRLPVFVVTHRPAEPLVDPGGSTFTFIAQGIEHVARMCTKSGG
jgi:dihydrofolate reductase